MPEPILTKFFIQFLKVLTGLNSDRVINFVNFFDIPHPLRIYHDTVMFRPRTVTQASSTSTGNNGDFVFVS